MFLISYDNGSLSLFFGNRVQQRFGSGSPAPASANLKKIGIPLRSGLGGKAG